MKPCTKKQFDSIKDAEQTLSYILTEGENRETMPKRVVYCGQCRKYHLTSMSRKGYERKRDENNFNQMVRDQRRVESVVEKFAIKKGWDADELLARDKFRLRK